MYYDVSNDVMSLFLQKLRLLYIYNDVFNLNILRGVVGETENENEKRGKNSGRWIFFWYTNKYKNDIVINK